ncbi:MAG TPA: response regulator transcription factor [Actinomycetota bacterium]|nr:response regulator transcription factor [Actinomycetota bacterium]
MTIRVMVVDDTDHVREMLATMLELDGFEVVAKVASGPEAIAKLDGATPDIVVMDYKMPEMDGITATRRLRELAPSVPVILYTAYIDDGIEAQAREAGAALVLGKVEGLEQLERSISEMCIDLMS